MWGVIVQFFAFFNRQSSRIGSNVSTYVLTLEPMREDCLLKNAKNCTITPHIAWAPKQTREKLFAVVADNLLKWTMGQPQNVVNYI